MADCLSMLQMVRVPLECASQESSKVATTLKREVKKRSKTSDMDDYRAWSSLWKSELKECVPRATASLSKYSGIFKVRCGQLVGGQLIPWEIFTCFKLFLKNRIVRKLMRVL